MAEEYFVWNIGTNPSAYVYVGLQPKTKYGMTHGWKLVYSSDNRGNIGEVYCTAFSPDDYKSEGVITINKKQLALLKLNGKWEGDITQI